MTALPHTGRIAEHEPHKPPHDADLDRAMLEFESGRERLLRSFRAHARQSDGWYRALEHIANYDGGCGPLDVARPQEIARAAL